jgi:hypothetical protein
MTTFILALSAWILIACLVGLVVGPLLADPNDVRPH